MGLPLKGDIDFADNGGVGREEGELRLAGLLLFLGLWGDGETSKLPRLMPYDPPIHPDVAFGCCGAALVLWREKGTGLSRSKSFRTGVLAEVEASWLRYQGHEDVRVRQLQ